MCSYNSNLKLTSKTLPIPCENKGNHIIKLLFFTNLHFLVFTSASYHTPGYSWNSSFLWNYLQSSFHCSTCSGIWFCPKRHKAHFFVHWKLSTMLLPWYNVNDKNYLHSLLLSPVVLQAHIFNWPSVPQFLNHIPDNVVLLTLSVQG